MASAACRTRHPLSAEATLAVLGEPVREALIVPSMPTRVTHISKSPRRHIAHGALCERHDWGTIGAFWRDIFKLTLQLLQELVLVHWLLRHLYWDHTPSARCVLHSRLDTDRHSCSTQWLLRTKLHWSQVVQAELTEQYKVAQAPLALDDFVVMMEVIVRSENNCIAVSSTNMLILRMKLV